MGELKDFKVRQKMFLNMNQRLRGELIPARWRVTCFLAENPHIYNYTWNHATGNEVTVVFDWSFGHLIKLHTIYQDIVTQYEYKLSMQNSAFACDISRILFYNTIVGVNIN